MGKSCNYYFVSVSRDIHLLLNEDLPQAASLSNSSLLQCSGTSRSRYSNGYHALQKCCVECSLGPVSLRFLLFAVYCFK